MGKRKLKDWVLPVLGIFVLAGSFLCYYLLNNLINYSVEPSKETYVTNSIIDSTMEVNDEVVVDEPTKPYTSEKVSISKYYYENNDEEEKQQNSLIRYQNIYMPNTGVLYSSDEEFAIISILDGKVTNIKEDDILGNIIEVEHDGGIVSIYQSVKDINVSIGDEITKGTQIATSGSNSLEGEKDNCLHFEVYKDGNLVNPEKYLNNEL